MCSIPLSRVPANPSPLSNPLAAGMLMHAAARVASSLSKTGEPRQGAVGGVSRPAEGTAGGGATAGMTPA